MKKLLLLCLAMLTLTFSIKADDDRVVTFAQLPAPAQAFHKQHFADKVPLTVTVDWDDYTIYYQTGEKVEFDKRGNWKSVDCRFAQVPDAIVPAQIKTQINAQFPGTFVVEIDQNRGGYDVKISNGLDLEFNRAFQLTEIDD